MLALKRLPEKHTLIKLAAYQHITSMPESSACNSHTNHIPNPNPVAKPNPILTIPY